MFKKLWNFSVVYISIFGLLTTNLYGITTEEQHEQSINKLRAAGEALKAEERRKAAEAYEKSNREAADAINTVHQNTGVSKETLSSGDVHKVTQEQINQASTDGSPRAAGKEATEKAAREIDASIVDEFQKDANGQTKADGILNKIKKATTKTSLEANYSNEKYSNENLAKYKNQLQKDVAMLVIGQVTSRLNECSTAPDLQLGIGAGQAFIVGEVAEYTQAEYLKGQLEESLKSKDSNTYDKQLHTFTTLKSEYEQVLTSVKTKQELRGLSQTAFYGAAALAAAEAIEDEAWAVSCTNENINMVANGSRNARDKTMYYIAMIAATSGFGAAGAIATYRYFRNRARSDHRSCEGGGEITAQNIINRKIACDTLGTEDMFTPINAPIITASETIKKRCLADGDAVSRGAGSGCSGYSAYGAGPYRTCDKASDAYKRNMVSCPASVLKAGKVATLESSGITSKEGREFVRKASEEVSRTVDLRIASPRHRIIVWTAFAELADSAVETNREMINAIEGQLGKINTIIDSLESETSGIIIGKVKPIESDFKDPDFSKMKPINFKNATPSIVKLSNNPSGIKLKNDNDHDPIANSNPVSLSMNSHPGFKNLPFELQTSINKVTKGLDTISNTKNLTGADFKSIKSANKELASIRNILNKKNAQLKSMSSKSKGKTDIDENSKSINEKLKNSISNALGKNNGSSLANSGLLNSSKNNLLGKSIGIKGMELNKDNSLDSSSAAKNGMSGIEDSEANKANLNDAKTGHGFDFEKYKGFQGSDGSDGSTSSRYGSSNSSSNYNRDGSEGLNSNENLERINGEDNLKLANAVLARNRDRRGKYESNDEQTIFEQITNAYIRNYDKILIKKNNTEFNK